MPRVQDEEILCETFSGRLDCSHGNRTLKLLCMEEDAKSLSNLVQCKTIGIQLLVTDMHPWCLMTNRRAISQM